MALTQTTSPRTQPRVAGRVELAAAVDGAFASGAVHRDQIVGIARARGARPEVLQTLARLPAYRYTHADQLWERLPRF